MPSLNRYIQIICTVFILVLIMGFGIYLRSRTVSQLKDRYLVDPDSYRHIRHVKQYVENGSIPAQDDKRHVPKGVNNESKLLFFPKLLGVSFLAARRLFPQLTLNRFAIFFSIFTSAIIIPILFLLASRWFGTATALLSVIIYAVLPPVIVRTVAGYFDGDTLEIILLLLSFFAYSVSLLSGSMPRRIGWAIASGFLTVFLGLLWYGYSISVAIIVLFNLILYWSKRYSREKFALFLFWFFPILSFLLPVYWKSMNAPFAAFPILISMGFSVLSAATFLARKSKLIKKYVTFGGVLSLEIIISAFFVILIFVVLALTGPGIFYITKFVKSIFFPFGYNRVMAWVSELMPTSLSHWWAFYTLMNGLCLTGLCLISNKHFLKLSKRRFTICSLIEIIGIGGIVTIASFELAGTFVGSLIFIICLTGTILSISYAASFRSSDSTDISREFALSWFIISFVLSCSGVRFHLFLAPIFAIFCAYTVVFLLEACMPKTYQEWYYISIAAVMLLWQFYVCGTDMISYVGRTILSTVFSWIPTSRIQFAITITGSFILLGFVLQDYKIKDIKKIVIFISTFLIFWTGIVGGRFADVVWGATQRSFATSLKTSSYPAPAIRNAIEWLKANTSPDSVIVTVWDLGSSVNYLADRATIVDEEQDIKKIQDMTQNVFCAESEKQALEFLQANRATHLLLNIEHLTLPSVFGVIKQTGYSLPIVPSDKYVDGQWRFHPIPIQRRKIDPVSSTIRYKQKLYEIKTIVVPFEWKNEIPIPAKELPFVVLKNENEESKHTIKEIVIGKESWYFPNGEIDGCIWVIGRVQKEKKFPNSVTFESDTGLYLTKDARNWLMVRLFMDEYSSRFNLIYDYEGTRIWEIRYRTDLQ